MQTSKKIILASYIICLILTIVVIVGSFMNKDVSNLTTITCLAYGELTTSNAFYFWKAKKENIPKIISSIIRNMDKDMFEKIDITSLLNQ